MRLSLTPSPLSLRAAWRDSQFLALASFSHLFLILCNQPGYLRHCHINKKHSLPHEIISHAFGSLDCYCEPALHLSWHFHSVFFSPLWHCMQLFFGRYCLTQIGVGVRSPPPLSEGGPSEREFFCLHLNALKSVTDCDLHVMFFSLLFYVTTKVIGN